MFKMIDITQTLPVWGEIPAVVAAWAFGSAQDGEIRPGGDVDIAVLLAAPPTFAEKMALMGRLMDALQVDENDLTILNEADAILRFEAVSGRLLFCRDEAQRIAFVSLTAREYEDDLGQWRHALLHLRD